MLVVYVSATNPTTQLMQVYRIPSDSIRSDLVEEGETKGEEDLLKHQHEPFCVSLRVVKDLINSSIDSFCSSYTFNSTTQKSVPA
jgi:hypothetical protein